MLLKSVQRVSPSGFREIGDKLPCLDVPVALIYGEDDRILPDVGETMRRVKRDLPKAQLTALPRCGPFLQEDESEHLAALLEDSVSA